MLSLGSGLSILYFDMNVITLRTHIQTTVGCIHFIRRTSEVLPDRCLANLTHEENQFQFKKSKNILDKFF
jgi:hypothetical protein